MGLLSDAGNVFPANNFKGNRQLAIPACITARASRTCRDACRDRKPTVAGKRSRHSRCMRKPQFYVSGKRPMHDIAFRRTLSIIINPTSYTQWGTKFVFMFHRRKCCNSYGDFNVFADTQHIAYSHTNSLPTAYKCPAYANKWRF